MKYAFVSMALALSLFVGACGEKGFDMGALTGAASGGGEASDSGAITGKQDKLLEAFLEPLRDIVQAQILLSKAFGLKETAAELETQAKVLAEGATLGADAIKEAVETSGRADDAIRAKLDSVEKLGSEGREYYLKSLVPYATSVAKVAGLTVAMKEFTEASTKYIQSAPPMEKLKATELLEPGTYVASTAPEYIKRWTQTTHGLITYGQKQEISIPKEATDALAGLEM